MADTGTLDANIKKAVDLAEKVGHAFIATSDNEGWPHVAAARRLKTAGKSLIDATEWFCPGTMANLKKNRRVSIIIWDAATDTGYQLFGEMEKMIDIGMLDGYAPGMKAKWPLPQIESQLIVRISKITDFKRAPHSDIPE